MISRGGSERSSFEISEEQADVYSHLAQHRDAAEKADRVVELREAKEIGCHRRPGENARQASICGPQLHDIMIMCNGPQMIK